MTPDQVKRDFIKAWLDKAGTDLGAARLLLPHGERFYDICGFHAQQAAEKFLKAFLIYHDIEPPPTHHIRRILSVVSAIDATLAGSVREADDPTPYAVQARYPGGSPEPDEPEARRLLKLASIVEGEVLGRLSPYLFRGKP